MDRRQKRVVFIKEIRECVRQRQKNRKREAVRGKRATAQATAVEEQNGLDNVFLSYHKNHSTDPLSSSELSYLYEDVVDKLLK